MKLYADQTFISIGKDAKGDLVGDAGFFVDTFIDGHIKIIYNIEFENIISIARMDPGGKMAATWGAMKSQR